MKFRTAVVVAAMGALSACAPGAERAAPQASAPQSAPINPSAESANLRYPVILPDAASQTALGVMEGNYGPGGPQLPNRCYYYGDGGSDLSLSNEFVESYLARGFTLRTICMGLISGIAFHPETGAALATVQAVNIEEATAPDYFGEPGPIGPETTIEVPDCFARGLPLSDCDFVYDPFSGERLTASKRAEITANGRAVLQAGRTLLASGAYSRNCPGGEALTTYYNDADGDLAERTPAELESCYVEKIGETDYAAGRFAREYHINHFHPEMLPYGGFVDVSPAFEMGFAYALFADGAAGPSFQLDDKALIADGKSRSSRAVLESLKLKASGG